MNSLLVIKQYVTNFINKFEVYLKPIGKLILALFVLITINSKLGYFEKINSSAIVLIAALMCSFMPMNFIVLLAALFVTLHMYALSLECAVITLVLFLVLFLLYFRLAAKDTIAVVLTPILTSMGIPYVMPVAMGLISGPSSAASIGCGVIVGHVIKTLNGCASALEGMATEDMAARFRFIIDSILEDKSMILLVVAFAITVFVTYFLSQLSIDFSWPIAIVAGALTDAVIVLIGQAVADTSVGAGGVILGTILAIVVGFICMFFLFNVNYSKAEKVQFQDDDNVYYVKVVPKNAVKINSKKAKKPATARSSNTSQHPANRNVRPSGSQQPRTARPSGSIDIDAVVDDRIN